MPRATFLVAGLLCVMSASAAKAADNPWQLQVNYDRRGSGVAMNYRIRWDAGDLKRSPSALAAKVLKPLASMHAGVRDILQSASLNVHGLRLHPFTRLRKSPQATAGAQAGGTPSRADANLYVLKPALEELRADARLELRRWVVRTVFNLALPSANGAPEWQKAAVASNLIDASRSWTR